MSSKAEQLLSRLENSPIGADTRTVPQTLSGLSRHSFRKADALVRFHERVLMLRAYPQNAEVLSCAEAILRSFAQRVARLSEAEADLSPLDAPEVSGIAGTSVTSNFSYPIARWLARRYPRQISI